MTFHIEYPRTIPARRPEGHQPAAPRYTLRWDHPVGELTCSYFAIQRHELDRSEISFFELARKGFREADGPLAHEIMHFIDEAGERNAVAVAYWTDPTAYARWMHNSSFAIWLASDDRLEDPDVGYWIETIAVPYDRHETIYSAPHYRIGFSRTEGSLVVPMTTNGYFGAARDRIPLSAIDPLDSPLRATPPAARKIASRGRRLRVITPHNLCVLRSGQYWDGAGKEQLEDYEQNLQRKLMRGMDYLQQHKQLTGTLELRVMTNIDTEFRERAETSVLAYFLSLEQLETWAKSHETHLEIYGHAIAMNRRYKEKREVVTWHEVFILPSGANFEYINCHPDTGLMRYFPSLEVSRPVV